MSFRARLTIFFVVIVVVPMVAIGVLVFSLINDSQQGKADARAGGIAADRGQPVPERSGVGADRCRDAGAHCRVAAWQGAFGALRERRDAIGAGEGDAEQRLEDDRGCRRPHRDRARLGARRQRGRRQRDDRDGLRADRLSIRARAVRPGSRRRGARRAEGRRIDARAVELNTARAGRERDGAGQGLSRRQPDVHGLRRGSRDRHRAVGAVRDSLLARWQPRRRRGADRRVPRTRVGLLAARIARSSGPAQRLSRGGATTRKRRLLIADQGRGPRRVRGARDGVQQHVERAVSPA